MSTGKPSFQIPKPCRHLSDFKLKHGLNGFNLIEKYFKTSPNGRLRFNSDEFKIPRCHFCSGYQGRLYFCLICSKISCSDSNHALLHTQSENGHAIAIDLERSELYCCVCSDQAYDSDFDRFVICKQIMDLPKSESSKESMRERPMKKKRSVYVMVGSDLKYSKRLISAKDVRLKSCLPWGLRGLNNLGNTCFMNSVLQALLHTPPFMNYFLSDRHNHVTCRRRSAQSLCLPCDIDVIFSAVFSGERTPYSPAHFLYSWWQHAANLAGYGQQDAHEFFVSMLDRIHEKEGKATFPYKGLLGVISMLLLSLHEMLHLVFAIMALLAGNISVAFADATVDACIAENSITHPFLAPDLQSLCELSLSSGELIGFLISGILVHQIGPQVFQNFLDACKALWTTLKCPDIWRPCLYMYLSLAVSVDIYDGMFYWLTDSEGGPSFSQETVGFISSIGSVGAIFGALLYQNVLKNHPFRGLFFWSQLLFGLSGMMDLVLVLRINLKFGIPDYLFAVIDKGVSNLVDKLKWLPLLVLSSRICPPGIEGTFFALLMSIQNFGVISSSWGGGLLLHAMGITRTQFHNLWLTILIRNILRVTPLCLLFLVPRGDPETPALANDVSDEEEAVLVQDDDNVELVSLLAQS